MPVWQAGSSFSRKLFAFMPMDFGSGFELADISMSASVKQRQAKSPIMSSVCTCTSLRCTADTLKPCSASSRARGSDSLSGERSSISHGLGSAVNSCFSKVRKLRMAVL